MSEEILKNYIDGKWVQSTTGRFKDVPNPATAEILAKVPVSSAAELDEAVQAAHKAFQDWRKVPSPGASNIFSSSRNCWKSILKNSPVASLKNTGKCWTNRAGRCAGRSRTSK